MDEGGNITRHLISTTYKVSPIPAGGLEVSFLLTLTVKRERIFKLKMSFVNDLYDHSHKKRKESVSLWLWYDYDYTRKQAENNEEESGNDEEIGIKLTGEENATNKNVENVIEID